MDEKPRNCTAPGQWLRLQTSHDRGPSTTRAAPRSSVWDHPFSGRSGDRIPAGVHNSIHCMAIRKWHATGARDRAARRYSGRSSHHRSLSPERKLLHCNRIWSGGSCLHRAGSAPGSRPRASDARSFVAAVAPAQTSIARRLLRMTQSRGRSSGRDDAAAGGSSGQDDAVAGRSSGQDDALAVRMGSRQDDARTVRRGSRQDDALAGGGGLGNVGASYPGDGVGW